MTLWTNLQVAKLRALTTEHGEDMKVLRAAFSDKTVDQIKARIRYNKQLDAADEGKEPHPQAHICQLEGPEEKRGSPLRFDDKTDWTFSFAFKSRGCAENKCALAAYFADNDGQWLCGLDDSDAIYGKRTSNGQFIVFDCFAWARKRIMTGDKRSIQLVVFSGQEVCCETGFYSIQFPDPALQSRAAASAKPKSGALNKKKKQVRFGEGSSSETKAVKSGKEAKEETEKIQDAVLADAAFVPPLVAERKRKAEGQPDADQAPAKRARILSPRDVELIQLVDQTAADTVAAEASFKTKSSALQRVLAAAADEKKAVTNALAARIASQSIDGITPEAIQAMVNEARAQHAIIAQREQEATAHLAALDTDLTKTKGNIKVSAVDKFAAFLNQWM